MAYLKLSEQVQKLSNPQRSDAFIKQFRTAVREGKFEAVDLPGVRFELPKQFKRRDADKASSKSVREMMFEATPEFEAWFEETNAQLEKSRNSKVQVSLESIESGAVDFQALAAATRQKMEASYLKGQQLGSTTRRKNKGLHRK
ncbi:hypothetical protein [Deinococcus sp. QL22]|uniref:hypothetical protein n=1 Tax=Deinococcus sp. QL22 TaxID=2939437 RepID=UPI002017F86D|nr:hypothetical protein [Deinococcus sp. QL22]UQN04867.1 hypothetical protein M1R55_07995 [Deinococcus sp. QL22]